MPETNRQTILANLRKKIDAGLPLVGGGAGTGISAKSEEAGGIDMIVIYNSGKYRMAGRGSLAGYFSYGNANEVAMQLGYEVLPVVKKAPVLAGVLASDPFCIMDKHLDDLKAMGFAGIQNFPTMGLIDGRFRAECEATGMSYDQEIEVIAKAHKKDMLTTPYVFSAESAAEMAKVGADVIVCHFGLTTGGSIGAEDTAPDIPKCAELYREWTDAAKAVRDDLIFIVHGGPLAEPEDAQAFYDLTPDCHGFYGASSVERLPTERAIKAQVEAFGALNRGL